MISGLERSVPGSNVKLIVLTIRATENAFFINVAIIIF